MQRVKSTIDEFGGQFAVADSWFDLSLGQSAKLIVRAVEATVSSVSGRNPNRNTFGFGGDGQGPLGFKGSDFTIGNGFTAERVNDFYRVCFENQLWSNPNQVDESSNRNAYCEVQELVFAGARVGQALEKKKANKYVADNGKNQIGFRSENFMHNMIIAGSHSANEEK